MISARVQLPTEVEKPRIAYRRLYQRRATRTKTKHLLLQHDLRRAGLQLREKTFADKRFTLLQLSTAPRLWHCSQREKPIARREAGWSSRTVRASKACPSAQQTGFRIST